MTALKTNRPKNYQSMQEVLYELRTMYSKRLILTKQVFKLRTVDICVYAVFVNYHNDNCLYYEKLNDYLNEKLKKKINKVSLHRIISIKHL